MRLESKKSMKKPMLESGQSKLSGDISYIQLTHGQRPTDRYLVNQINTVERGAQPIQLVCLVEIVSAWHHAREVGNSIAQTFVRQFSQSRHQSTLTKLEDALKQLNTTLEHQLDRFDVSPSCVLLVAVNHEVYFSTLGGGTVALLRKGRLSSIGGESKDGNRSFTTVTSGELDQDDWLFCANDSFSELIHHLEPETLGQAAPSQLRKLIAEQAELTEHREHLNGLALRLTPGNAQTLTLGVSELESRTPIKLPSLAIPKIGRPKLPRVNFQPLLAAGQSVWGKLQAWSLRQRLTAGLAVVIAVAIIFGVTKSLGRTDDPTAKEPTLLSQLAGADVNLRQLIADKLDPETFHSLSAEDQTGLQNLLAANAITLLPLSSETHQLPEQIIDLDTLPDNPDELFVLDSTGQLWQRRSGAMVKLEQKQLVATPISLAVLAANKIVITDEPGNVWLYDGTNSGPVAMTLPTSLPAGKKLVEKYAGNLYILADQGNQIFRVVNFSNSLGSAASYTRSGIITNVPIDDWAINGSVQLLGAAGRLISLQRNSVEPLNINFPVSATKVDSDTSRIVATGGKFTFGYDSSGTKTHEQFVLSRAPISAMTLGSDKHFWLAIDAKIYRLAF